MSAYHVKIIPKELIKAVFFYVSLEREVCHSNTIECISERCLHSVYYNTRSVCGCEQAFPSAYRYHCAEGLALQCFSCCMVTT